MGYFYIDDSVHDKAGFVIAACLYSPNDLETQISQIIVSNGFDPISYEFKSGANFTKQPQSKLVRNRLKGILQNCKLGVVIIPRDKRDFLGTECIKAIKIFLEKNILPEDVIYLYFDQGLFHSIDIPRKIIEATKFTNCNFNFEQDSKVVKGIQLADLAAHSTSIYFKERLGLITKKIKAGPHSDYDPDLDIELGFELWTTFRYSLFNEGLKEWSDDPIEVATLKVEPYGLYISQYCSHDLAQKAREAFAEIYLGCIH